MSVLEREFTLNRRMKLVPLVVGLVIALASCGAGQQEEALAAVRQELRDETARVRILESQLSGEKSNAARLQGRVDESDAKLAALEPQLAREKESVARLRERIGEAEAREALLAIFLAWNRKDEKGFAAGFTGSGISKTLLSLPESIGDPPISLRRVMDTTVSGDTATIHAMYGFGTQRSSVRHFMVKENGAWKIDHEEQLAPKIQVGTITVEVELDQCTLAMDTSAVISRDVAFIVNNVGGDARRIVLARVLEGGSAAEAAVEPIAYVNTLEPGAQTSVAFTEPLAPGRYAFRCLFADPDYADGAVAEFTVE